MEDLVFPAFDDWAALPPTFALHFHTGMQRNVLAKFPKTAGVTSYPLPNNAGSIWRVNVPYALTHTAIPGEHWYKRQGSMLWLGFVSSTDREHDRAVTFDIHSGGELAPITVAGYAKGIGDKALWWAKEYHRHMALQHWMALGEYTPPTPYKEDGVPEWII